MCTNSKGGFSCSACPSGYVKDTPYGCKDYNECAVNNGGCDSMVMCNNKLGAKRTCDPCPSGYSGDSSQPNGCKLAFCGNGKCEYLKLENCTSCPGDCPSCQGYVHTRQSATLVLTVDNTFSSVYMAPKIASGSVTQQWYYDSGYIRTVAKPELAIGVGQVASKLTASDLPINYDVFIRLISTVLSPTDHHKWVELPIMENGNVVPNYSYLNNKFITTHNLKVSSDDKTLLAVPAVDTDKRQQWIFEEVSH